LKDSGINLDFEAFKRLVNMWGKRICEILFYMKMKIYILSQSSKIKLFVTRLWERFFFKFQNYLSHLSDFINTGKINVREKEI